MQVASIPPLSSAVLHGCRLARRERQPRSPLGFVASMHHSTLCHITSRVCRDLRVASLANPVPGRRELAVPNGKHIGRYRASPGRLQVSRVRAVLPGLVWLHDLPECARGVGTRSGVSCRCGLDCFIVDGFQPRVRVMSLSANYRCPRYHEMMLMLID